MLPCIRTDGGVEPPGRLLVIVGDEMGVGVNRDPDRGVAEPLGHDVGRHALRGTGSEWLSERAECL